ncbi:MAG: glycoside hydrolase family 9 protein [Acidobacteria bacterium]|nr:glycoside hydrolase family 9 protein [Acidobacteriota bacterium]
MAAPAVPALERFALMDSSGRTVLEGKVARAGMVPGWKGRHFWIADFSSWRTPGRYRIAVSGATAVSEPFEVGDGLLADVCLSDILFYFKGQRCSGEYDAFDRRVPFFGGRQGTVDVHGGWFDASGDDSKYLTHLSYASFMNPQQQPQVVWNLLAAADLLRGSKRERLRGLVRRCEDEARHGADFLVRMQDPEGYFYTTVHDVWTHEPKDRTICSFRLQTGERDDRYKAGWRMGAGSAIAALARASTLGGGGEFPASVYLAAALRGFRHLRKHNREVLPDGRENIIDDYCALLAACELYRATGEAEFLEAARSRSASLCLRLSMDERYEGWWRADGKGERPFWHAVEAGLPVVALLRYLEVEPAASLRPQVLGAISASLKFELGITSEVVNPFGLARQYVQGTKSPRRAAFFMPHDNESGYWWQGENARLASLAAAALLAARTFSEPVGEVLRRYGVDQLDWILGLNPFDVCMLQGRGRNSPDYLPGFPNAPGGICNGVTSGVDDANDIAFLPPPWDANPSHNWRWSEQWLPHGAWMFLALSALESALAAE